MDLSNQIDKLFENNETSVAKDLKINLSRLLSDSQLGKELALMTLLATARASDSQKLEDFASMALKELNISDEQIREAKESAAIMAMMNTYYRFKYMLGKEEEYKAAGLRMTSLAKPVLGKENFEALALAVSIINGCANCIKAHEDVLIKHGYTVDKVHDLARIASVVKATATLLR